MNPSVEKGPDDELRTRITSSPDCSPPSTQKECHGPRQRSKEWSKKKIIVVFALILAARRAGAISSRLWATRDYERRAATKAESESAPAPAAAAAAAAWANSTSRTTEIIVLDSCDRVGLLLEDADPGMINKLRRKLASEDPACFERRFSDFATHFRHRLDVARKHLNLHIPKAGGTALCQLAKSAKKDTPPSNCWHMVHFIPLWYPGFRWRERPGFPKNNTCDVFDKKLKEFTMNENYLDYPLCMNARLYSILLRRPVDRAMSQERHYMATIKKNPNITRWNPPDVIAGRLNLIRKNYMTWSLTSGLVASRGKRLEFAPERKHLRAAKDTLSRMDFLLEITPPGSSPKLKSADSYRAKCLTTMVTLMGFKNATMKTTNAAMGRGQSLEFNRSQYNRWNTLDIELYQYATKLAKLDCDFFHRIVKGEGVVGNMISREFAGN
jgi:hypothetical protein